MGIGKLLSKNKNLDSLRAVNMSMRKGVVSATKASS